MSRFAAMGRLGVDIYAPRRPLSAAAPSVFAPQAPSPGPRLKPAAAPGASRRVVAELDLPRATATPTPSAQPVAAPKPPQEVAAVRFQLLTVAFESLLVVSELKSAPLSPALEASVLQFLREVLFALGKSSQRASPAYFHWPLVDKPGVDNSASRAGEVLQGFLERQLREFGAQQVLVLGEQARRYAGMEDQAALKVLHYPAGLGMLFARPQLKAGLWELISPLKGDG